MSSNIKNAIAISTQLLEDKSLPEADLKLLELMKEQLEEYLDRAGRVTKILESITKLFMSIFDNPP